jgi:hypothetical protein
MGACISSPDEAAERDRKQDLILHREAEKLMKEVCLNLSSSP